MRDVQDANTDVHPQEPEEPPTEVLENENANVHLHERLSERTEQQSHLREH